MEKMIRVYTSKAIDNRSERNSETNKANQFKYDVNNLTYT